MGQAGNNCPRCGILHTPPEGITGQYKCPACPNMIAVTAGPPSPRADGPPAQTAGGPGPATQDGPDVEKWDIAPKRGKWAWVAGAWAWAEGEKPAGAQPPQKAPTDQEMKEADENRKKAEAALAALGTSAGSLI